MLRRAKSESCRLAMVVAAVSVLAGCSKGGEGSEAREPACGNYFSPKYASALGEAGESRGDVVKPGELRESLREDLENWGPGSPPIELPEYIVCHIQDNSTYLSTVEWSVDSMRRMREGGKWDKGPGDVYFAKPMRAGGDAATGFPCKISGTDAAQESELPIEVRVGVPGSRTHEFEESMALDLARSVRKIMQCENNPVIPEKPGL
ncbi:hypothetical protein [Streptomyces xanthii]|uniref:DUF3558 domain-containing protein n=1 Tax=Streptomyces xanthii TaxID=2768069 RepID=A0A7H1B7S9_9ACTN|nr:hypothetical protein [Streptomyces xanthii]QNS04784.1 hypothetical protein IAG42_14945 [Streptomyces xanthii]